MKYVLIIPDGCADETQSSLGGKTPLQSASVPNMDAVTKQGMIGQADNVPLSMPPGSDVGTMSLFGYDPLVYHTGRAPIEAAAQGIELGENDWAIRCNLVSVIENVMKSFTAEQIPNELGRELVQLLQKSQYGNENWKYQAGISYRNLLIYRGRDEQVSPFDSETDTTPPHDISDQSVLEHLPSGTGSEILNRLMEESVSLFQESKNNLARKDSGHFPATQIWLWGQGSAPKLPLFKSLFNVQGAVITAVDLLRGLGQLIGWETIEVPGATGYLDTDYQAKGEYAIDALSKTDFVVVHVEATDEASHEGDAVAKVKALEEIDSKIVGPVHEYLKSQGDYRILISPDHPTYLRTKTHSHGYVPFTICGHGITSDSISAYSEVEAAKSSVTIPGHEIMPLLFKND